MDEAKIRAFTEQLVELLQGKVLEHLAPALTFLARGNAYGSVMAFGATAPDDARVTWVAVLATRDMATLLSAAAHDLQRDAAAAARKKGVPHLDQQSEGVAELIEPPDPPDS